MTPWHRLAHWWRTHNWQPSNIARGGVLLFLLLAYTTTVAVLPASAEMRADLVIVITTGALYLIIMWLPILPGKRAVADATPFLMAVGNMAWITLAVQVFSDETPLAAILYGIPVTTSAIRYGLRVGFWSAFLASCAYFALLDFNRTVTQHIYDLTLLVIVFTLLAFLTGSLSQAITKQRRQFENVVAVSREAIAIIDAASQFEFINPATLAILNYRAEDLLGHSIFDLSPPLERASAQRLWRATIQRAIPERIVNVPVLTRTGERRTLALSAVLLEENPRRYVLIGRDITAQEIERAAHERRHRELEAERAITIAVSQTHDLERVLTLALEQALVTLKIDSGAIFLADEAQTTLALAITRNIPESLVALVRPYRFGEGITGNAAAQRQVLFVSNIPADERVRPELRVTKFIQTQVSVPLITHDRVVGVLNLSTDKPHHITAEDVALLRVIGASVALAIDRARLVETLEQRVNARTAELVALNRIAAATNQTLELEPICNAVLDELTRVLNVRGAWLSLIDSARTRLVLRAERGSTAEIHAHMTNLSLGEGLSGLALQELKPQSVNLEESPVRTRAIMRAAGYRSLGVVPLVMNGQAVGILGLAGDEPDYFGEAELRFLSAVGNTVAVAMQNAELFEASQRRVKQLTTLREIDHALNSMLELAPMLETMLERLVQIITYDSAAVFLREGNLLRAVAARGRAHECFSQFAFDISHNPVFAHMNAQQQPEIVADVTQADGWVSVPGAEFVRGWLGIPLVAREQVIGQIGLYSATPHAFTAEQGNVMHAFASHAAVAIANARLREELNDQAQRDSLTQVLNHGAFLSALRAACDAANRQGGSLALIMLDLDFFKDYNDTYGHVIGDHVLTILAQAIRAHIKSTDLVGRWGGEEFCIALHDADAPQALIVAERIRATLATTPLNDQQGICLPAPTASQGIAAIPHSASNADELINRADAALYRAKGRGRDQVVVS